MLDWYTLEKQMIHREQATVQYLESRRLLLEALECQPESARPYDRALAAIGHWLMDWGRDLQERHGDKNLPPVHRPMRIL